jgi:hypothetical protein
MDDRGGLVWRTSSKSSGGACVAVATDGEVTHIRDSKDPTGPTLTIHDDAFRDFIAYIKGARR